MFVVFWQIGPSVYLYDVDLALMASVGAIGLNLLTGYAGQVSIGNAAFLAIGAYSVVMFNNSVPFPLPIVIGTVFAALVGFVIGIPSLRLKGLYLIFSTLALQFVVAFLANTYDSRTHAIAGHFLSSPKLGGWTITSARDWFIVFSLLLAAVVLFVWNIVRGRPGRAYAAIQTNEASASVMGVNVMRTKLGVFTISSAIIGLAGATGAYFLQDVGYTYYSLDLAVSYIAMILIGGLASIWGSIVGAVIVTMLPFFLQNIASSFHTTGFVDKNLSSIDTAIYGLAILMFLYFRPGGIASLAKKRSDDIADILLVRPNDPELWHYRKN